MKNKKEMIYSYIVANCVGEENAISAKSLCIKFDLLTYTDYGMSINDRALRKYVINPLRKDKSLDMVINSSRNGYFVGTKEETKKTVNKMFAEAFELLRVARTMVKKSDLNGQGEFDFENNVTNFVKSLTE